MRGRPNDPNRAKAKARAHAKRVWFCPCGKKCRGNGGISSHRRACSVWAGKRVWTDAIEAGAHLDDSKGGGR